MSERVSDQFPEHDIHDAIDLTDDRVFDPEHGFRPTFNVDALRRAYWQHREDRNDARHGFGEQYSTPAICQDECFESIALHYARLVEPKP